MKRKAEKNFNSKLNKKLGSVYSFNKNSLSHLFFNQIKNRYKISLILDFLDINEQLPLIKMNSVIAKIIIQKYNLPFKSVVSLREYKNNKNVVESKYSKIYKAFKNIININNIEKEEYQYIISFLLKNMNNNYIIFDNLEDDINIFFEFLKKIKYIKNINHIKFALSNCDIVIEENNLEKNVSFINLFQNIKHLEIDKIEKSFYFFNKLICQENNCINKIEKINLTRLTVRIKEETSLKYDDYNSLLIPKLTNLKYIFLNKINLSISFLKEIINCNQNLTKLIINNCHNNNISINNEEEQIELINKSLNNCQNLNYVEFNKNDFSDNFSIRIIKNLIDLFFKENNNIYMISCGFFREINLEDIYNNLNNNSDIKLDKEKFIKIKFSPSFSYHIINNKRTIEISNFIRNVEQIRKIKYDKIKLCLYNTDNSSILNNIKKVMDIYNNKNSLKYFQIFATFKNGEINYINNLEQEYINIKKFTLIFQNDEEAVNLFGNKIIFSILIFFPCVKIISFKNINFQNDDKKFREYFDDLKTCLELILFGEKNEIMNYYKNKEIKLDLTEIKFYNCYYYKNSIDKYILNEINTTKYLGKKIKLSFID